MCRTLLTESRKTNLERQSLIPSSSNYKLMVQLKIWSTFYRKLKKVSNSNKTKMINSLKPFKLNVMKSFKDSKTKLIILQRELLNSKLNLLKKSQSETRKLELLLIRENIEDSLKKKLLNSTPPRFLKNKNGLLLLKNTIRLNTSLKRPNKSLLTPLRLDSSKKAKPLPSLKSQIISINTPKTAVSRGNHGTQSSSSSLKLLLQLPSKLNNHQYRPLLIFAIKFLTRLLNPEKSKEKTITTG